MKQIWKDSLKIGLISIALLAVMELILRFIYPEKIEINKQFSEESPAFQFDEDYLVSLKPFIKKYYQNSMENGGTVIHWETNSKGFRGKELKKNPDYRVVVYGDSNVQARFSTLDNTFPVQLATNLNKTTNSSEIEVINAGVVGAGPDQYYLRMVKELPELKPQMVIFHITGDNDFGDLVRNRLFELDESRSLKETRFEKKPDSLLLDPNQKEPWLNSLLLWKAINKLSTKLKKPSKKELIEMYLKIVEAEMLIYKEKKQKSFSQFEDHYDFDLALFPEKESSKIKKGLMRGILELAKNEALENGVDFIVVMQPSIVDMTKNANLTYEDFTNFSEYKRTNITDVLSSICVELEIPYVNLFPVFLENDPDKLYLKMNDDHWNDAGQHVAGKEVADFVLNRMARN